MVWSSLFEHWLTLLSESNSLHLHILPLKFNQEKGNGSPYPKPICTTCGKKHYGKCLAGTNGCYGCGKIDHQVKDCPTLTAKEREAKKASLSGPNPNAPKYGRFYALRFKEDKEALSDEGTGMLMVS